MGRVYRARIDGNRYMDGRVYQLPAWLSARDVTLARMQTAWHLEGPTETENMFELRLVAGGLEVEAGFVTHLNRNRWQHLTYDERSHAAKRLGEDRYIAMPSFLYDIASALDAAVLTPNAPRLAVQRKRGDYGAFRMVAPRHEHDYNARAVALLPRQSVRDVPLARLVEDVAYHARTNFHHEVDVRLVYESRRF
jgi:hypothetical protein